MALITLEEFRRMRDQFALDGYYQRWPMLNERKQVLQKERTHINVMLKTYILSNHGRNEYETEKKAADWKYQDVIGEMAMIERDAPIRKERLANPIRAIDQLKASVTSMFQEVFGATPRFIEEV